MFTKRHYEWLAEWARNASMAVSDLDRHLVISSLCDRLERQAKADGVNFKRHLFLRAAGVEQ